jgi:phage gp45-like
MIDNDCRIEGTCKQVEVAPELVTAIETVDCDTPTKHNTKYVEKNKKVN